MKQVPSVTLQSAVLLAVKDFANQGKPFSIFDITQSIRTKCNNGELEIPEVEMTGGGNYRFQVEHTKVKALFLELRDTGVFDPDFSLTESFNQQGRYRTYEPVALGNLAAPLPPQAPQASATTSSPAPTPSIPVAFVSPTSTSGFVTFTTDVAYRVTTYLANCKARNFRPTLRHVQSAIKRGEKSTGYSVEALRDFIGGLGFNFSSDPNSLARYQVVV